ncbi:hypothetical protein JB92DRAFT_3102897 [Gautieria morchelliformis]|nr:hypothetical protein JB92DRAFT_3102897 [Gautieria morchelliformis]
MDEAAQEEPKKADSAPAGGVERVEYRGSSTSYIPSVDVMHPLRVKERERACRIADYGHVSVLSPLNCRHGYLAIIARYTAATPRGTPPLKASVWVAIETGKLPRIGVKIVSMPDVLSCASNSKWMQTQNGVAYGGVPADCVGIARGLRMDAEAPEAAKPNLSINPYRGAASRTGELCKGRYTEGLGSGGETYQPRESHTDYIDGRKQTLGLVVVYRAYALGWWMSVGRVEVLSANHSRRRQPPTFFSKYTRIASMIETPRTADQLATLRGVSVGSGAGQMDMRAIVFDR